jgi:hypothetical protein
VPSDLIRGRIHVFRQGHAQCENRERIPLHPMRCGRGTRVAGVIAEKPHRGSQALRRAVWALLLPAGLGLSTGLNGCAELAAGNAEMVPTAPDPGYRLVIANHLKRVLKNSGGYDAYEISEPRWVHSIKGWTWLTCVRFTDRGRPRTYVVFFDGEKIVDDRFSVQTDNCDTQAYSPFERMQTGLDPLH